jgi:hypothetical protein
MTEQRKVIVTDVNEKPSRRSEDAPMPEPLKFGKRYRVTFEGTANPFGWLTVDDLAVHSLDPSQVKRATSIERIPDPEPDWEIDDICEDAEGQKWRRVAAMTGNWRSYPGGAQLIFDDAMRPPLKPIMLGGRYVGGEQ